MIFDIKVHPNASKNELKIINNNNASLICIELTAPPVKGKANLALIRFLSKYFKIPKTAIEIKSGYNNKYKKILFKKENQELISFYHNLSTNKGGQR